MLPSIAAAIIAGSPDAVLVLDADGRYRDANPAACQLLGYSREEMLQLRSDHLIPPGAPWLEAARAGYRAAGSWRGEIELLRKEGPPVLLDAYSVVIPSPEGPLYTSYLRDNTPEREDRAALTHERDLLRTLMAHLPDVVYIKDTASRFLRLNRAAAHSLGLDDPTDALAKTDFDFYPEDRAREYFTDEQQVISTGVPL